MIGHQLRQPVDLPIAHLEDTAGVLEDRARLQLSEGDNLRDRVAAVFLLHIADHLAAAGFAEVDVEVGHRHALGVQEALEQKAEFQRIEIGDSQRPGDDRPRARTAPRRSEEHTSELQSLMRISYAVFCLKKTKHKFKKK